MRERENMKKCAYKKKKKKNKRNFKIFFIHIHSLK